MASTITNDYVSQDVVMTWQGIPMEAYADSFVSVSYLEDKIVGTQGPDGDSSYSKLPATHGTIEVTLQQESPTHRLLAATLELDGIPRGTFLINNPNGDALYVGLNACIMTRPTVAYGKTHEDGLRTWVFHCSDLKVI